jgi:hypothetical protein
MHRRSRVSNLVAIGVLGFTTAAFAQTGMESQAPSADPTGSGGGAETALSGAEPGVAAAAVVPRDPSAPIYGVVARWRYIMVPGWFLGLFSQKNVPLYTAGSFGLEGFRRKIDKDDPNHSWEVTVGVGYQNMSPPDGYWLGKGKDKQYDTDLVQARDLSLITMDAAFISRQYFNRYFGIHYGAGLGLGIVRGKLLRTSATYNQGNGQYSVNVRDPTTNQVVQACGASGNNCNEAVLSRSSLGGQDLGPTDAHRFQESSVPGALPIINLLLGIDVRAPLPNGQALEFRLEGGFFDAFFIGTTVGYQI